MIALMCLLCLFVFPRAEASAGDRSTVYQNCLKPCLAQNCSTSEAIVNFTRRQSWYLRLFCWDCLSECEHECMWFTVNVATLRGYSVPQFHGKWPFVRIFGIQEPASVIFSLLNGLSHFVNWQKYKRTVPKTAPNYWLWQIQAALSVNAWIWSTIFHSRDTALTEKLDYFCAFSLVLYGLYSISIRVLQPASVWLSTSIAIPFLSYFTYHIHFLTFIHFDYGYNMRVNIIVGMASSLGWLMWCFFNRRKRHVLKCAICILVVNVLLLLEVLDFPPWGFVIDAHSLWHLSTVPIPYFWYKFLIEDTWHLMGSKGFYQKQINGFHSKVKFL